MKNRVSILFLFVISGQGFANQCDDLEPLYTELSRTIEAANKKPYEAVACPEKSKSDEDILVKEIKGLLKGVLKGKIPNPTLTAIKAFLKPSEIGTSSELCYVPSDAAQAVKYQLDQLKVIEESCE